MPYPFADVTLNGHGSTRWRGGHPWVYRAGITVVEEDTGREAVARVRDARGHDLGWALISRESQITLRKLDTRDPVDEGYWRSHIAAAAAHRARELPDRDAYRVVYGESDSLPGLVVDRYGDHLAVQFLAWGTDALREDIAAALVETLAPKSIIGRGDAVTRRHEGLPLVVSQVFGTTPEEVLYREGPHRFQANLASGQKTGAFLDQIENHLRVGDLARGRVLDGFCFTGGFSIAAASKATEVIGVDSSETATAAARRHAELNGIENATFVENNVFDYLRERDKAGDRFDMVVLDPPAFAKSKGELAGALRGYKEINLRAMKILAPGGILVSCSCSYHLSEEDLDRVLSEAAADARRPFRVLERRGQPADHPVRLGFPESRYLKCHILEALS